MEHHIGKFSSQNRKKAQQKSWKYVIIVCMDASLEEELLLGAQRLDPKALTEIYNVYNAGIYAYSMRLLGEPYIAEDCVSETFSRFLQAVYSRRGPQDHLKAYLYRIAHNWITDYYRRKPTVPLEVIEDTQPDDHLSVPGMVDKNIRQTRLRAALSMLGDNQRQVILLHYMEGWDDTEIASTISKSISAVKAIQYRAVENLRKILMPDEAGE
jgi:RNA polymerase sigma-70 factor, ECF subfamily